MTAAVVPSYNILILGNRRLEGFGDYVNRVLHKYHNICRISGKRGLRKRKIGVFSSDCIVLQDCQALWKNTSLCREVQHILGGCTSTIPCVLMDDEWTPELGEMITRVTHSSSWPFSDCKLSLQDCMQRTSSFLLDEFTTDAYGYYRQRMQRRAAKVARACRDIKLCADIWQMILWLSCDWDYLSHRITVARQEIKKR